MCFCFFVYLLITQLLRVHYIFLLSCFILLFCLSPFIILFVFALFHTFLYVTLFTINTSVITLPKKEGSNSRNSCTSNFISSQYSLQSGFALACLFHRLPHLWLSTMLLKVHHFISLCFLLFASHFAFTSLLSQFSRHTSGHIDFVTSLASHFAFGHFITHTHTLSLSLSHFPFGLHFLAVSPLSFTSHTSASCHTPRPHVTHLGLLSRTSAARHTSQLCITHLGFSFSLWFLFFVLVLRPLLSCTVSHLGFTSCISASRHTSQLRITRLASHFCPSASL